MEAQIRHDCEIMPIVDLVNWWTWATQTYAIISGQEVPSVYEQ